MEKDKSIMLKKQDEDITDYNIEDIGKKIYTIRGKKVMIDSDVANLYHYETKRINEAVKRNADRFSEDFCFKLTDEEYSVLKSQIATSNESIMEIIQVRGGKQKLPYVFTEKGIIMLSGLLKNNEYIKKNKLHKKAYIIQNESEV